MMKRNLKLRKGFTLIELLIAVTIISILFSLGFANYRSYAQRQALYSLARVIEGDLQLAKTNALSGKKPVDCGESALDGYEFSLSGEGYVISALCKGPETGKVQDKVGPETEADMSTYSITSSLEKPIIFKTIGHGTNIDNDKVVITVESLPLEKSVEIEVLKSGEIKIVK